MRTIAFPLCVRRKAQLLDFTYTGYLFAVVVKKLAFRRMRNNRSHFLAIFGYFRTFRRGTRRRKLAAGNSLSSIGKPGFMQRSVARFQHATGPVSDGSPEPVICRLRNRRTWQGSSGIGSQVALRNGCDLRRA